MFQRLQPTLGSIPRPAPAGTMGLVVPELAVVAPPVRAGQAAVPVALVLGSGSHGHPFKEIEPTYTSL